MKHALFPSLGAAVPIYDVQQGASITEYQWLNEARALSDVLQH